MKSYPLTRTDKETIQRGLLIEAFGAERKYGTKENESKRLGEKWGMKVYTALFTTAERRTMNRLPKNWLPETNHFRMKLHRKNLTSVEGEIQFKGCFRVPDYLGKSYLDLSDKKFDKIRDALVADLESAKELSGRHGIAERAIHDQLKSIRTSKQLSEQWPEAFKHFPTRAAMATALVAPIQEVNKMLGLPKPEPKKITLKKSKLLKVRN